MDHAVGAIDIGRYDRRFSDGELSIASSDVKSLSVDRRGVIQSIGCSGRHPTRHHVVGQDCFELLFVLRSQQRLKRLLRQGLKAFSVGAKTVNGPGLLSVWLKPAASTAASKVPKSPATTAVSTISSTPTDPGPVWYRKLEKRR